LKIYTHLTLAEREKLFALREQGLSFADIEGVLRRSHSTLSREYKKNTRYGKKYLPCSAQKRAVRVGTNQRYKAPLKGPEIFLYVRTHLKSPYFWTPGMISMHIEFDINNASIDTETIYRYIYSKSVRRYKLWELLPRGRAKRMKLLGRKIRNNGKVPNSVSIDLRPKTISKRNKIGHWETDNVEGPRSSKPALSVSVERLTRLVVISKIPNQTALVKTRSLTRRLNKFHASIRLSITQDNGKENYGHQQTALALGTRMYFCHAYRSWEKGSVENRNAVVRRFFPKGIDFASVTAAQIQFVETVINNMPMKCLGKRTPYEKMQQLGFKLDQFKP